MKRKMLTVDTPSTSKTQERRSFWEIWCYLTCPVVGTCLSLSEQKKILKKAGISLRGLTDYDIHGILVQSGKSESPLPLSCRVHRYLDNKFRRQVVEIGRCSEKTFLSLWQNGLKSGEIEGLLWVGATNPNLSEQSIKQIFADIHMIMHHQGNLVRQKLRQAALLRAENQKLKVKLLDTQKRARESAEALHASQNTQAELECKLRALHVENEALKHSNHSRYLQRENETLRPRLEKAERRIQTQAAALDRAKMENNRLSTELDSQSEANRLIQVEIDRLLWKMGQEETECETCFNRDLCTRRVLLVGGISKLFSLYRKLVENVSGEFKYHDGRNSGGERALKNLIGWADFVFFPIDVNSHSASLGVKKICKKMGKPYHILSSASLSSFARALENVEETICRD